MPRVARLVLPDVALHVVQRGNNRLPCFFRAADYQTYLRYLVLFAGRYGCAIHAYCLMTNHVHLLLTPRTRDSCAFLMKRLGQCYVQTINRSLGRTGTLWEGRFRSCLVASSDYVVACYRYIELNPVRAGMVRRPDEYPWSSFLANAAEEHDPLLSPHPALESVGAVAYRAFFDAPFENCLLEEIRKATRNGYELGKPRKSRGRPAKKTEMGSVPIS